MVNCLINLWSRKCYRGTTLSPATAVIWPSSPSDLKPWMRSEARLTSLPWIISFRKVGETIWNPYTLSGLLGRRHALSCCWCSGCELWLVVSPECMPSWFGGGGGAQQMCLCRVLILGKPCWHHSESGFPRPIGKVAKFRESLKCWYGTTVDHSMNTELQTFM